MVDAFWARTQVELLNRKRWKTRTELATAMHDYIDIAAQHENTPQPLKHAHRRSSGTNTNDGASPPDSRATTPRNPGPTSLRRTQDGSTARSGGATVAVQLGAW